MTGFLRPKRVQLFFISNYLCIKFYVSFDGCSPTMGIGGRQLFLGGCTRFVTFLPEFFIVL